MKLNKLKEIKNVYSIVKLNDTLLVSFDDNFARCYEQNNLDNFKVNNINLDILLVFKNDNNIYLLDVWNKLFEQKSGDIIPFMKDYFCSDSSEIENHIVLFKGKIRNRIFCVYSLSKKQILWELDEPLDVIGSYCFQTDYTFFKARNIETGTVLWDKNITDDFEEGKTYKFLTVYNNVLVVAINDTILAGYNVTTGNLIWQVKDTNNRNLVVDKDGKLKGVISTGYFETDIATGIYRRIEFAPFEAINKPGWFESQRDTFVIIDNYIITTDFYSNRIGAFNMQTMQYDWFYTEENATGFPASRPIKYFEPYLCLIDNKDTLHIYEVKKDVQVGNIKEIIKDLEGTLTKVGNDAENLQKFLKEMGESSKKAKGGAFTLKILNGKWDELTKDGFSFVRFEGNIPDIETKHKLDLLFRNSSNNYQRSIELKNWKKVTSIAADEKSQFYQYVKSKKEFRYYFNDNTAEAKLAFQNIFKNRERAKELWDLNLWTKT